jgi:hypothetical protein
VPQLLPRSAGNVRLSGSPAGYALFLWKKVVGMGLTRGLSSLVSGIGGAVAGLLGSVSNLLGRVMGLVSGLLRAVLALILSLVATVVLVVAAVLCATILLLPLGIPLGALALSLYGKAAHLLLPGSSRFEQLMARGESALRRRGK